MTKIDQYFQSKGIKTIFNCLGANDTLTRAYVGNYHKFISEQSGQSQKEKLKIYSQLYDVIPRTKQTGFENLQQLDCQFRNDISKFIIENQFTPLQEISNDEHDSSLKYKDALVHFVSSIENPLVYISGGADSEVVARAFLQSGNKARFVIFEWLNNGKHIINSQEVFHAYRFCKRFGIVPIIEQINIEELWQSQEFQKLAIDIQIQSPQLVTYAFMISHMSKLYPTSTHVFGGEVRFHTKGFSNHNQRCNLVYLDKIFPSFQIITYVAAEDWGGFGGTTSCYLQFEGTYTWQVLGNNILTIPLGGPTSGNWAVPPFFPPYEIQVCVISGGGSGISDPENGCTPWQTIAGSMIVATVYASSFGSGSTTEQAQFSVQYRQVGNTGPGVGGNPTLIAQSFN